MNDNRKPNRLANEKSPYLLQHAYNPVDWYPWGDEAFEKAKAEDKPVFLSIGYSACHWCHVMERECFENKYVAQLLNDDFVSIKVDREEMPDVDHFYMSACTAMTGSGGWPLTLFLTHDRTPFFAGTYFPEENFMNLLNSVDYQWRSNRSQLTGIAEEITKAVGQPKEAAGGEFDENAVHRAFARLGSSFDKQYGGFGDAPKFPSVQNLLFFLRYSLFTGNGKGVEMMGKTMDAMARGGIFDHIGGGFCRYSTDRKWLVPHFEKMMIDNALLTLVYLEAGAVIEPRFGEVARRILTYSLREMRGDSGFYTAQDADSEGEEGKYYLFTPAEVESVLGSEDGERFCKLYDITKNGNFEGKNIPNRIDRTEEPDPNFSGMCFEKLYQYRAKRISPFLDDKCLACVNGLMVAALSAAARLLHDDGYAAEAEKTARFILDKLMPEGRLRTGYREGPMAAKATLDDYAYVLWGFYELYQATLDARWLAETTALADKLLDLFYEDGALYLSGRDALGLPVRTRSDYDGAYPAGSGVAVNLLYRMGVLTENQRYEKTADAVMNGLAKEAAAYPAAFVSLLCADLTRRHGGALLTLTPGEGFAEMKRAAEGYNPFLAVHLSMDLPAQNGRSTAYLCTGKVCLPPETDAEAVRKMTAIIDPATPLSKTRETSPEKSD